MERIAPLGWCESLHPRASAGANRSPSWGVHRDVRSCLPDPSGPTHAGGLPPACSPPATLFTITAVRSSPWRVPALKSRTAL